MLQEICAHIHNFFVSAAHTGTWTISDGTIALDFLKEGQRFWIVGSDLNDGVYTYHETGITDDDDTKAVGLRAETFSGTICAMSVDTDLIKLAGEVHDWVESYDAIVKSPYSSESFNGYQYTKAGGGGFGNKPMTWQTMFSDRLNQWRKICI